MKASSSETNCARAPRFVMRGASSLYFGFALCLLLSCVAVLGQAPQTQLAIINEDPSIAAWADLLTAELSKAPGLQLLERAEVQRIHKEQSMDAAGGSLLKTGQLLGADGLLIIGREIEGAKHFLEIRLVAVKPGVVIAIRRAPLVGNDALLWASFTSKEFIPLLPKLTVLPGDVRPLSVVNLRSAQTSRASQDLERQLTALSIERLSREKTVFVLERRRLQMLGAEKELQGLDDSAFWNGAYLLEGIVDRDGYSPDTVTVHATLVPPRGGARLSLAISGSRTNLSQVIELLTRKVTTALNTPSDPASWSAEEEAEKYLQEAQWALKWEIFPQAQAAADAAWALGRQDVACAMSRVQAYLSEAQPDAKPQMVVHFIPAILTNKIATAGNLRAAVRSAEVFADFSRTLPLEEPIVNSPWYKLGLTVLEVSSRVLKDFHAVQGSHLAVPNDLAELRGLSREIAAFLSRSPSVKNGYWFTAEVGTHDKLFSPLGEANSIWRCKAKLGCYWQEQPQDCLSVYRELMTSAAFSYVHRGFLLDSPRLVGWNEQDTQLIPGLWRSFVKELNTSTNPVCRIEAKFIELSELHGDSGLESAVDALFDTLVEQRSFLVTNMVETAYTHAETTILLREMISAVMDRIVTGASEGAVNRLGPGFARLGDVRTEFLRHKEPIERAQLFNRQKDYLSKLDHFDTTEFAHLFSWAPFSKGEATEIEDLLSAYKSNRVDIARRTPGTAAMEKWNNVIQIDRLHQRLCGILGKPPETTPWPTEMTPAVTARSSAPANSRSAFEYRPPGLRPSNHAGIQSAPSSRGISKPPPPPPVYGSNLLQCRRFTWMPTNSLAKDKVTGFRVFAQRARQGKLILELRYGERVPSHRSADGKVFFMETSKPKAAAGIWDCSADKWDVIVYPEREVTSQLPMSLIAMQKHAANFEWFEGSLYISEEDTFQRYDTKLREWNTLPFPGQQLSELVAVNGRLFAANAESIFEITGGGAATTVLASCRRRPALSVFDELDSLGRAVLLPAPAGGIRALVQGGVYVMNGATWSKQATLESDGVNARCFTQVCEDGAVIKVRANGKPNRFWFVPFGQPDPVLCWQEQAEMRAGINPNSQEAAWASGVDLRLSAAPLATARSNLFFLITKPRPQIAAQSGDAPEFQLVCLTRGTPRPLLLPLGFAADKGPIPAQGVTTGSMGATFSLGLWMQCSSEYLFIGQERLPGAWILPLSELETAMESELQALSRNGLVTKRVEVPE